MRKKSHNLAAGFKEWASLFSGKLFVQIEVYCDESDTHKPPKNGRAPSPTVYGWIAERDYWGQFQNEWQAVLGKDEYKVPYFHFGELHPLERKKKGKTYYGWPDSKVEDFKIDLSLVAGRIAVPCGSSGNLSGKPSDYEGVFKGFFKNCFQQIDLHWPNFKDRVDFFFERSDRHWGSLILGVANKFPDTRLGAISFPKWDDRIAGRPLQAADLLACTHRESASWFFSRGEVRDVRIIDYALRRNVFPRGHRWRQDELSDENRKKLISAFQHQEKALSGYRAVYGLPEEEYYPLESIREDRKKGMSYAYVGSSLIKLKQR